MHLTCTRTIPRGRAARRLALLLTIFLGPGRPETALGQTEPSEPERGATGLSPAASANVEGLAAAPPPSEPGRPEEEPASRGSESEALTAWAAQMSAPCKVRALAKEEDLHLLACGGAGLWRVRASADAEGGFVLVGQEQRGGEVVGFTRIDGALLVLVDLRVVQPLEGGTKVVTGSVSFVDSPHAPSPAWGDDRNVALGGTVASTKGIRVQVDLPRGHGVGVGYRIAFSWGKHRVVGRVVRASSTHADVLIGLHEAAPPIGTAAASTPDRSTARIMGPPDGDYHYRFDLGVLAGFSRDGIFGAEGGVSARYGNLALSAEVRPFAFSTQGIEVVQAFVSVGVSTTWFGISLGGGVGTVNRHDLNPPGTGILMTPAFRFGAIDGLNVRVRPAATFHRQEMVFSALFVDAQVPISRSLALLAGGGGGDVGIGQGEVGLRSLVHGNGGKGSWFLHTTSGATVLVHNTTVAAPHLKLVVETRL